MNNLSHQPDSGIIPHSAPLKTLTVPVRGGDLLVSRTGNGPNVVLALHGVAGSRKTVEQLSAGLDSSYSLLTPDLRGRGASSRLPGPFGLDTHAEDCAAILDHFAVSQAVVVGHSLGALIAERLAVLRPSIISGVVMIDGGLMPDIELPAGTDMGSVILSVVGPVLDNLRRTYATKADYFEAWRTHPAFQSVWNETLEARFQYDLEGDAPEFRSRISAEALQSDMTEALSRTSELATVLRHVRCPMHLFRATRGILDQPTPMIDDRLAGSWCAELPQLQDTVIPDTNHISITLLERAVRQIGAMIQEFFRTGKQTRQGGYGE